MDFARQQSSTSRLTGVGFVIVFHVALIYGLIYGLAHSKITILPAPILTKIIKELKPPPPPPPPPIVTVPPPPPVYIPPPEVNIAAAPSTNTTAITNTTNTIAPPPPPAAPAAPTGVRVAAQTVMKTGCPDGGQLPFPNASQRLGESGVTQIQMLVDASGKVIDSRVLKSSGFPRLDQAAQDGVKRCKFKAGTLDGVPEAQSWGPPINYVWRLQDN